MLGRRTTHPTHRSPQRGAPSAGGKARRRRAPLDAATLILELEMAALVRRAGDSLRQHPVDREQRSWWRRLLGTRQRKRA
jgi:hypothetical protein